MAKKKVKYETINIEFSMNVLDLTFLEVFG